MRRALSSLWHPTLAVLLLGLAPLPQAWAAGGAPPEQGAAAAEKAMAAPAEDMAAPAGSPAMDGPAAEASPWEHPLWFNATTMMRIYVCDHARRPPSWCSEPRDLPANTELAEPQGPPLIEADAKWLAFLDRSNPAELSAKDIAMIRRRAAERRDPQAMEILGYLYAEGLSVERDYVEAYRWYGLAFLAGEQRVRANMDVVWQQLQRHDLEGALALTREFDALARGELPAHLAPQPAAAEAAPGAGKSAQAPASGAPETAKQ